MTISVNATPDGENNPFVSLRGLLSSSNCNESLRIASVATLATAIDLSGIYTWDKFGRFKLVNKESPECQFAFNLLASVYKFETNYEQQEQHPLEVTEDDPDDPYSSFGWAKNVLPNFENIKNSQSEIVRDIKELGDREKSNYLRIIAALLEFISGENGGVKHPSFSNEKKLIEFLDERYKSYGGLSKSNLSRKFPEAKRKLLES